ncbi:MAG: glycosyltransferase family 4 protein [Anaerolineae bacterium]
MRIGIFAADLTHRHGWAHYSLSVIRALRRAKVDMVVLTTHGSPVPDDLHDLPVYPVLPSVDPMERRMIVRQMALIPTARRLCADCDVIHTFVEPFALIAAWTAGKRPLVITGHGSYVCVDHAYPRYLRAAYTRAFRRSAVVCVSRYTARTAERTIPGLRTQVIPNGVDVERFAQLPPAEKHGNTLLTVGAVKRRKGVLELVRGLSDLLHDQPAVRCAIVGSIDMEPAYVETVRAEITARGLADHVTLYGRVSDDDLMRWYARADVFAAPSMHDGWKFEGFGLAALEASAAGLPVIGAADSGLEDAIDDGVTGYLVPPGDSAAFKARAVELLKDAALRQRMGEAGRAKARLMTWDAAAESLAHLYARL